MNTAWQTLLLVLALGVVSCKRDREHGFPLPEVKAAELNAPAVPSIPPAIEKSVQAKGEAVVSQAFGVLSSRLGKAIADAGLTNAIAFCSVHGIPLTTSVGVTNEVVLRRVSHQPRNSQNRADANEAALIRHFESELTKGAIPSPVVATNKPGFYTYYSPLVLSLLLCLSCHGQPDTDIQPHVLAELRRIYPGDEATGFKLGQVRGLWSVDFKRSDFLAP